jgi:hypothetical protein
MRLSTSNPIHRGCRSHRTLRAAGGVLLLGASLGAAPHEDAFMRVWNLHRQAQDNHAAMAAACREATAQTSARDAAPLLGAFLPVVRTIEGWHLLQDGRTTEAQAAFEAALDRGAGGSDTCAQAADTLARRWLSRIDREQVIAALQAYYREHVSYPDDLAAFNGWTPARRPPLRDRKGDPWLYQPARFRRLTTDDGQRYVLTIRSIGRATSDLAAALALRPSDHDLAFALRQRAAPALVELRFGDGRSPPVVVQEGGRAAGLRLVAIDGIGRFLLLCDDDFWHTAIPARGGRP